jgi:hypothetical protein
MNSTQYWGNLQWYLFHLLSYTVSDNDLADKNIKKIYLELFLLLLNLMPCIKCYNHSKEILNEYPIDWKNKENMINWFYNFHNLVNKFLGKQIYSLDDLEIAMKKPINHLYLIQIIKYYTDRVEFGHSSSILVVKMLKRLIKVYPCLICKKQLLNYNSRYKLNENNLKVWITNILEYQKTDLYFNCIKLKI